LAPNDVDNLGKCSSDSVTGMIQ